MITNIDSANMDNKKKKTNSKQPQTCILPFQLFQEQDKM